MSERIQIFSSDLDDDTIFITQEPVAKKKKRCKCGAGYSVQFGFEFRGFNEYQ